MDFMRGGASGASPFDSFFGGQNRQIHIVLSPINLFMNEIIIKF